MKTPMNLLLCAASTACSLLLSAPAHAQWSTDTPQIVVGSKIASNPSSGGATSGGGPIISGTDFEYIASASSPYELSSNSSADYGGQWQTTYTWTGHGTAPSTVTVNIQEAVSGSASGTNSYQSASSSAGASVYGDQHPGGSTTYGSYSKSPTGVNYPLSVNPSTGIATLNVTMESKASGSAYQPDPPNGPGGDYDASSAASVDVGAPE